MLGEENPSTKNQGAQHRGAKGAESGGRWLVDANPSPSLKLGTVS